MEKIRGFLLLSGGHAVKRPSRNFRNLQRKQPSGTESAGEKLELPEELRYFVMFGGVRFPFWNSFIRWKAELPGEATLSWLAMRVWKRTVLLLPEGP
ncbi:MAG: hypothetical protein ACLTLQ_05780 [[Clostridium] scindens]